MDEDDEIRSAAYEHFAATTAVIGDSVAFEAGWRAAQTLERAARAHEDACADYEARTGANALDMPLPFAAFLPPAWRR
jgi:hypothetical protein